MAHNVEYKIDGTKLTITFDISDRAVSAAPPSSTGKSALVGSTSGYMNLNHEVAGKKLSVSAILSAAPKKG